MSANQAILEPSHERVAILISKDAKTRQRHAAMARSFPELFNDVIELPCQTGPFFRLRPRPSFRIIKQRFGRQMEARVFTGNDRRIEFQYAMHVASRCHSNVEGIYLDEGAVTYMGHKSMHRFQHRYVDPFFKKCYYGSWYKLALTTGASDWVHTIYAAFPDAVHPLLKNKKIEPIDRGPFQTKAFKQLAVAMLEGRSDLEHVLRGIKIIWSLPYEGAYAKDPKGYQAIFAELCRYLPPSQIAIKPHPRITNPALLDDLFPGVLLLEHRIGMEALLPLLDSDCIVAGDISTTLLTTRWLRPDLHVIAIMSKPPVPVETNRLYQDVLKIPVLSPLDVKSYFQKVDQDKALKEPSS